jgi:hypothetical protein
MSNFRTRVESHPELAFLVAFAHTMSARARRLRKNPDAGSVSIETAVIVAVMCVVAGALAIAIKYVIDNKIVTIKGG